MGTYVAAPIVFEKDNLLPARPLANMYSAAIQIRLMRYQTQLILTLE